MSVPSKVQVQTGVQMPVQVLEVQFPGLYCSFKLSMYPEFLTNRIKPIDYIHPHDKAIDTSNDEYIYLK